MTALPAHFFAPVLHEVLKARRDNVVEQRQSHAEPAHQPPRPRRAAEESPPEAVVHDCTRCGEPADAKPPVPNCDAHTAKVPPSTTAAKRNARSGDCQ